MEEQVKYELIILLFILVTARVLYLIHKITTGFSRKASATRTSPCKAIICIGSGGHTTEMISLLNTLDFSNYSPRYYVVAKSDETSIVKLEKLERSKNASNSCHYIKIPRSRVVGQSYVTSIFTSLYSMLYSIPIIIRIRPDLILCNGPGTCIPICLISFLLKVAFIADTRIVFIESYCRTQTFSLTGKILMYIADNFVVQWPCLKQKLKRAEYIGQLM